MTAVAHRQLEVHVTPSTCTVRNGIKLIVQTRNIENIVQSEGPAILNAAEHMSHNFAKATLIHYLCISINIRRIVIEGMTVQFRRPGTASISPTSLRSTHSCLMFPTMWVISNSSYLSKNTHDCKLLSDKSIMKICHISYCNTKNGGSS